MSEPAKALACDPSSVCQRTECPHHMVHCVFRSMRARPLEQWPVTCGLACPKGTISLEDVGALLGATRERVRQVEARALAKLAREASRRFGDATRVADFLPTDDGV